MINSLGFYYQQTEKRVIESLRRESGNEPPWSPDGPMWVEVKNPGFIKSENSTFAYSDHCVIDPSGRVVAMGTQGNKTLMTFLTEYKRYGTDCPSGVVFFDE
jgi:hypothetical protein